MYTENKTNMPRESISDELLLRMLDSTRSCCNVSNNSQNKNIVSDNRGRQTFGLEGYPLASMYAPLQKFKDIYDKETALSEGTVFAELNLPFMGASVVNGGKCYD